MTTTLDERIADLIGPADAPVEASCPVILEMDEALAANIVEGLRCALYGGAMPAYGRRALVLLLDATASALSTHEEHGRDV